VLGEDWWLDHDAEHEDEKGLCAEAGKVR
jgi:hypothetical protein